MGAYDSKFFGGHREGAMSSARVVLPIVRSLVRFESVIDVGCGTGEWLSALIEEDESGQKRDRASAGPKGAGPEFLGLDGAWALEAGLSIPRERFEVTDLSKPPANPPERADGSPRRFDLAISLEVAEHLPEAAAVKFVSLLTECAPVVLFSAAIPGQGGTNHINEQWPDYWAELFAARGYGWADAVRPRVWADSRVRWWYAQNTLIFAERGALEVQPMLRPLIEPEGRKPLRLVHPECFDIARNKDRGFKGGLREAKRALKRMVLGRPRRGESA